ncbi:hypothetical protein [Lysobacter gummosus]
MAPIAALTARGSHRTGAWATAAQEFAYGEFSRASAMASAKSFAKRS